MAVETNVKSLLSIDGLETESFITPDGTFRSILGMDTNSGLIDLFCGFRSPEGQWNFSQWRNSLVNSWAEGLTRTC